MSFDFETAVPKKAMENEGNTMSFFSNEAFKISKSKSFEKLIIDLYQELDTLDCIRKSLQEKSMYL